MNLLIDMGNTRLKWAICNNLDIISKAPVLNKDLNQNSLTQLWQSLDTPSLLAISCVSTNQLFSLVSSVAKELWPSIRINRETAKARGFGVFNAYPDPESLGVDRWLGMVAGYRNYKKSICIAGCGTAITVDVVDATGRHLGGLISPGLRLMKESLAKSTENLGIDTTHYPYGLANFTAAAIHSGTLAAACGLIERTLSNQPEGLQLILTGGDAEIIAEQLSRPAIIDRDLVLRGLALTLSESK